MMWFFLCLLLYIVGVGYFLFVVLLNLAVICYGCTCNGVFFNLWKLRYIMSIGRIRFSLVCGAVCVLLLSGCESFKHGSAKKVAPKISIVTKPALHEVISAEMLEKPKLAEFPDAFLEYLHLSRLNLAAYNREKSLDSLNLAYEEVEGRKLDAPNPLVLVKVEFAKRGFASTPAYLVLNKEQEEQIRKIVKNLHESKQELSSVSLVYLSGSVVTKKAIDRLGEGIKALKEVDGSAPDYDFAIADRAVRGVYEGWRISPYKSDGVLATKYYLNTAKILLDEGYIDIAEELVDDAEESYTKSYADNVLNSDGYDFVNYYKEISGNLRRIIDKDKTIKKRVNRKVKGVLDYLF